MKKYIKLLIITLMAIFSVVSLSSCDFINRALSKLGLGGNPETTATSGDPTAPIQSTTVVDDRSSSVITPSTSQSKTTTKTSTTTNTSTTKTTITTTTPTTGMSSQASSSSSRTTTTTTTTTTASSTAASTEYALDYGYNDLARYVSGEKYQELYIQFNEFLDDFYTSTSTDIPMQVLRDSKLVTISSESEASDSENIYCVIGDIDYTKYNIESNEATSVFKSVLLDNPQYYFISNSLLLYTYDGNKYVKVSIDPEYRLGSTRLKYNNQIANYLKTFDLFMPTGLTDKEKVRYVHDFIKDNASYAYESDGKTPSSSSNAHNILGIISEKKGVCESYTELFTYILKYLNIPAITITGTGYTKTSPTGENHAWNYVMIDGKYYGFDLTWDDSVGSDYYYGLSYSKIDNISGFNGSGAAIFIDSKIGGHRYTACSLADGFEYLYQVPSCSTTDLK